jgi:hypothetical protein
LYGPVISIEIFVETISIDGLAYTFAASIDGNIPPYLVAFSFGDGSANSFFELEQPGTILQRHTYSPGTYRVRAVAASTVNGQFVNANVDIEVIEPSASPTIELPETAEPVTTEQPSDLSKADEDTLAPSSVPSMEPTISIGPSSIPFEYTSGSPSNLPTTVDDIIPTEQQSDVPSFELTASPSTTRPPATPDSLVDQELRQQNRPSWANGLIGIATICGLISLVVLSAIFVMRNISANGQATPTNDQATDEGAGGGDASIPDSSLYIPSVDEVSSLQSMDLIARYDGEFEEVSLGGIELVQDPHN